jgi:hypothetical protein
MECAESRTAPRLGTSMTPHPLLPQQMAPVDPAQASLTSRHLLHEQPAMMDYFLALRAETDAELAPVLGAIAGKPYPFGRCEEITGAVVARMKGRINRQAHRAERAIHGFAAAGGIVRRIWGELKGIYFQNAIQFGGLYVDVANDTVDAAKPKVEILPLQEAPFRSIRDLAHFASIAEPYWGTAVYANHAVPSLAPLLPMISARPDGHPRLQSACDYMIDLMRRDGFREAEAWLGNAPPPPPEVVAALLERTPEDLRPVTDDGRAEAVAACRQARLARRHEDIHWRNARVGDFLRLLK